MSRKKVLHIVFDSVRLRLPAGFGFAQFERAFDGWDTFPLVDKNALIGGVLVKGNEIHVGYTKTPGFVVRRHIKQALVPLVKRYGCAKTAVSENNSAGLRFCTRLGFHEVARFDGIVFLRCEKPNYV